MCDKLSPRVEELLQMKLDHMDRKLVTGIISQFGGEDAFFEKALAWCRSSGNPEVSGFITDEEVIGFLANNKKELIEHIAVDAEIEGFGSCIEFIADSGWFGLSLSLDEVAEGLHDTKSEFHTIIARKLACFAAGTLIDAYDDQKECEKLRVVMQSNGFPRIIKVA